jgi:hypothetical protein
MSDVQHIGGDLKLYCPARHHIGTLRQISQRPNDITYLPRVGDREPWPPQDDWGPVAWWTVPCPDGCPGRFGGVVDVIRGAVNELAADPDRYEGKHTLVRTADE